MRATAVRAGPPLLCREGLCRRLKAFLEEVYGTSRDVQSPFTHSKFRRRHAADGLQPARGHALQVIPKKAWHGHHASKAFAYFKNLNGLKGLHCLFCFGVSF